MPAGPPALPPALRPGTDDEVAWLSIMVANEYRLPARFRPDDVVLDLGAHVGVFSHAALERGSHRVIGYEVEETNHARAVENLAGWGDRVTLHRLAVWRSDRTGDQLRFRPSFDPGRSGGGNVLYGEEGPVLPLVAFDDVVRAATAGGRRVRFLKLDVEAAEFPILLTAGTLAQVDEIAGEFHELGGPYNPVAVPECARVAGFPEFTIEALAGHLRAQGFHVWWVRVPKTAHSGLFFAERRGWLKRISEGLKRRLRRLGSASSGGRSMRHQAPRVLHDHGRLVALCSHFR